MATTKIDPRPLKCPICGKTSTSQIEKLMTGPQGYRRYKVCMTCAKKADDQKKHTG